MFSLWALSQVSDSVTAEKRLLSHLIILPWGLALSGSLSFKCVLGLLSISACTVNEFTAFLSALFILV